MANDDRGNSGKPGENAMAQAAAGAAATGPASTSNPPPGARLSNPLSLFASYTYQLS